METHELIETSISVKSVAQIRQQTRRCHAEHHEATLDSARVGVALPIPSGATPDFSTSGGKRLLRYELTVLTLSSFYSQAAVVNSLVFPCDARSVCAYAIATNEFGSY